MRRFVFRAIVFAGLVFLLLASALFFLPNPLVKKHMLYALVDKHELLRRTPGPRIVFVGGSNVAYGLDSKRIADALRMPVVNAGLHSNLGMKFYLADVQPYIRKGDIVVVAPEYRQFYTNLLYGAQDLVSTIFDVDRSGMNRIGAAHWVRLIRFMPFYAAAKIRLWTNPGPDTDYGAYRREAFNRYGDAYLHWDLPPKKFSLQPKSKPGEKVDPEAIRLLADFQAYVHGRHARLVILPPVFQSTSFANQKPVIEQIYQALLDNHLPIIAPPERYSLPDSLFYDSNYHLLRAGARLRSELVAEDLGRVFTPSPP